MTQKDKLLETYEKSFDVADIDNIPDKLEAHLENITNNIERNKAVYTVLVTLMTHKLMYPEQDIRYFQDKMKGGFSARTVDTKYITPTLKELRLASMSESGWLTRSLEQPYPYTMDYQGEISGKGMKESFLTIINAFQEDNTITESLLRVILNGAILLREKNHIEIKKLTRSDEVMISTIINILDRHFSEKYHIFGGSKLPTLAFYAIYKSLVAELIRYKDCILAPLNSHNACDRTSQSSGDIEIMKGDQVFEVVEVKLDKLIDTNIVENVYEKVIKFNPERYYILSYIGTKEEDKELIENLISKIRNEHGCQIIVNGLLHTLRYYLRLISNPKTFFNEYIELVENDTELKIIHKEKLKELIEEYRL